MKILMKITKRNSEYLERQTLQGVACCIMPPSRFASSKSLTTDRIIEAVNAESIAPLRDLKSKILHRLGLLIIKLDNKCLLMYVHIMYIKLYYVIANYYLLMYVHYAN